MIVSVEQWKNLGIVAVVLLFWSCFVYAYQCCLSFSLFDFPKIWPIIKNWVKRKFYDR